MGSGKGGEASVGAQEGVEITGRGKGTQYPEEKLVGEAEERHGS